MNKKKEWFDVEIITTGVNEKGANERLKEVYKDKSYGQMLELYKQFEQAVGETGLESEADERGGAIKSPFGDVFKFERFTENDF